MNCSNDPIYFHGDYDNQKFTGPVFIIGMPRSGTKLVRNLLNRHPRIGIPDVETNFLPLWAQHWETFGDLSKPDLFKKFYRKAIRLSYFHYMKAKGAQITADAWYDNCRDFTLAGIFEALLRHDANIAYDSNAIWGDKSPVYIRHINLIKQIFPTARFVHIIRDVRDYCLSNYRAWGKNMIRAAQRWNDDVGTARKVGKTFQDAYLEIRYEDLVTDSDPVLKQVCHFLGVEFDRRIKNLIAPVENLGDAKGLHGIKKDNLGKYHYFIPPKKIRKIESITAPVLLSCGYSVPFYATSKRVKKIRMTYYKAMDGYRLFIFDLKEKGISTAAHWMINRMSSQKRIKSTENTKNL